MEASNSVINLKKVLNIFYSSKLLIVSITLIISLSTLFLSTLLINVYNSNATLQVNESQGKSSSGMLGGYADLAGMAGISLPKNSDDKGILAVEIIRSRDFFSFLMEKYDLKLPIMASGGFDQSTGEIIYNKKIYDIGNSKWVRKASSPLKPEPNMLETHAKFIEDILSVGIFKKTGFIDISINHHSPIFANELLEIVIFELNETARKRDLKDAKNAISFLNSQLSKYSLAGNKNIIFKLMEQQLHTQMMAEVEEGYLLKVIDSPSKPVKKIWPSRIVIVILGTFFGFAFSLLYALLRYYYKINV